MPRKRIFGYSAGVLVALAIAGNVLPSVATMAAEGSAYERVVTTEGALSKNPGIFDRDCADANGTFDHKKCSTKENARILVWGDSFAMHLAQMFESGPNGIVQATKSSCFPNSTLTPYANEKKYTRQWASQCHEFSRSVMDFAANSQHIETVVIASTYAWPMKYDVFDGKDFRRASYQEFLDAVSKDVATLRSAGKKVVFVSPTPQNASDALRCSKKIMLDSSVENEALDLTPCSFKGMFGENVEGFLQDIERAAAVEVFDLRQFFCNKDNLCSPTVDGMPVYFDFGHLTLYGTRLVEKKFGLGEKILLHAT